MNGAYMKDLSVVDADLSKVCLVDNSPASYAINQGVSHLLPPHLPH
jgi:CTD nuclear envelope phosphatase 1